MGFLCVLSAWCSVVWYSRGLDCSRVDVVCGCLVCELLTGSLLSVLCAVLVVYLVFWGWIDWFPGVGLICCILDCCCGLI